jgi:hypothetical protein
MHLRNAELIGYLPLRALTEVPQGEHASLPLREVADDPSQGLFGLNGFHRVARVAQKRSLTGLEGWAIQAG